jgi:putative FmdB family regulatory protein
MPIYEFECLDCKKKYEVLCGYDYKQNSIKCEACGSKKKTKLVSNCSVTFASPGESSKWESFSYRAGYNMDKAKKERTIAERNSRMGGTKDIYGEE